MLTEKDKYAIRPLIEDRTFLTWSASAIVILFIFSASFANSAPFESTVGVAVYFFLSFITSMTAMAALVATGSALLHSYRYGEVGWTWIIVFTLFIGAYLYGFFVASSKKHERRYR